MATPMTSYETMSREELIRDLRNAYRTIEWHCVQRAEGAPKMPSMDEVQLACGNLSPREFRAVKAALQWFVGRSAAPSESSKETK